METIESAFLIGDGDTLACLLGEVLFPSDAFTGDLATDLLETTESTFLTGDGEALACRLGEVLLPSEALTVDFATDFLAADCFVGEALDLKLDLGVYFSTDC